MDNKFIFVLFLIDLVFVQSQLLPPHYSLKGALKSSYPWNKNGKFQSKGSGDSKKGPSYTFSPLLAAGGLYCSDKDRYHYVVQNITFTFNPNGGIMCAYFGCSKFESSMYECGELYNERGCRCGDETKTVGCKQGFAVGLVLSFKDNNVIHADIVCFTKHEMLIKTLLVPDVDITTEFRLCPAGQFMCGLDQSNAESNAVKDLQPMCCTIPEADDILHCTFREDVIKVYKENLTCPHECEAQAISKIILAQQTDLRVKHVWDKSWMDWSVAQYFHEIISPTVSWGIEKKIAQRLRSIFPDIYRPPPGLSKTLNDSEIIPFSKGECWTHVLQLSVNCGIHLKYLTTVAKLMFD